MVKKTKSIFARFGIPQVLVSDNGPQFVSKEFSSFMEQWGVDHVVSSPHHQQGNGKVESAVKTAKHLMKKTIAAGEDLWLAILEWRNIPTAGMATSPAQRMLARQTRTTVPTAKQLLRQEVHESHETHQQLVRKRQQSK